MEKEADFTYGKALKSKPKSTLANQLTYNWSVCESGLGPRVCWEENSLGSGQSNQNKMSDKRKTGWKEERRSIAARGWKAQRPHSLPGDARQRREASAFRAQDLVSPTPPFPSWDPAVI